nr:GNAT family N-acetyltransferase [uncultured Rhodopila sp.]
MDAEFGTPIREPEGLIALDRVVRVPTANDVEGLAALFSEMQQHYRRPVIDATALNAARLACRPPESTFDPRVLIAVQDDRILGSIVLNVTFPAFELSLALYIRDLYVSALARRSGVGRDLVNAAARLTYAEGYSALDWTTEATNQAAQKMYESCGARLLSRIYYRLAREDLTRC